MNGDNLVFILDKIKNGDSEAREKFLEDYKPYVTKIVCGTCKRYLEWGVDDELSIGLIAFNSAIDTYSFDKKVPFLHFAQIVIQNRLKDFFRHESRFHHVPLWEQTGEEGKEYSAADTKAAWEQYLEKTIEDERQEEIISLEKTLAEYGIDFEDLVLGSPKHRDAQETAKKLARALVNNKELFKHLIEKKQLPVKELMRITGANLKMIERRRKYIITLALILGMPEEFSHLRSYVEL